MSNLTDAPKSYSFEEALAKLQAIVEQLESEDVTLDRLVKDYEHGMGLVQYCRKQLEKTEQKIEKIIQTRDGLKLDSGENI